MRLAGNDHFVIKEASGAKTDSAFQRYNLVTEHEMKSIKWKEASGAQTDSAFQRYNLVTEHEMKSIKWLDEKGVTSGTMDTYMDTNTKTEIV
jgi:hypothetical protein